MRFDLSHQHNIQDNIGWLFLIFLQFVKRFVWYIYVFNKYSYYCDLFCLGPASRLCEHRCHVWVHYIDTAKDTVPMFVWYRTVNITDSSVWGKLCVFVIVIVMCKCALFIIRKLWLRVCHWCYCILIYDDTDISLCFILNWPILQ